MTDGIKVNAAQQETLRKTSERPLKEKAQGYLNLGTQNSTWIAAHSTKVVEPKLEGGGVYFRIVKENGIEKLQMRLSDWRFPNPIEGIVESVDGKKGMSAVEKFKRIASADKVRVKLEGAGGEVVLERSFSDILSYSEDKLGVTVSTWHYLDIPRPGVNIDSVKEKSLAEKIGLDRGEVILGAIFRDEKGQERIRLFNNVKDFFNLIEEIQIAPQKYRSIRFIIKQPHEGREEVLKALKGGQSDILTNPPIIFDPIKQEFRAN